MSTTVRDSGHDDIADLVVRTLHAVADATPVDDAPSALPDGEQHDVIHLAPATAHRRARRARLVRVAAGAAAVAVVAGVVWARSHHGADDAPTDVAGQHAGPLVRMEAGWLPEGLDTAPTVVERRPGIAEPVEAVMWGTGRDVVVAAVVDSGDDADPIAVRRRLERVRGAFERVMQPADAGMLATEIVGGRGAVAVGRSGSSPEVQAIATRIAEGAAPADAAPDGVAPQGLSTDWLTGIGPSATVGYQAADQSAAVAITVVAGDLPEPAVLPALQPGAEPVEVRGHAGWSVVPAGSDNTWVTWQEEPGLVVTVDGGLPHDDLLAVAEDLVVVDEPAASGDRNELVATGTVEGMHYRIESAPPEDTGRGWCASLVLADDPIGPVCENVVDGAGTEVSPGLLPVATYDGGHLWWGAVPSTTATVTVDGAEVEAAVLETVPTVDAAAGVRLALVAVPGGQALTFGFHDTDGEELGSSGFVPPPEG